MGQGATVLQKAATTSCYAGSPNYAPCPDSLIGIQVFYCDIPCNPPPDNWTMDATLQLHPFPDTTFTWLDGTIDPKVIPVDPNGNALVIVESHAWWGVFHFDFVLRDKNGQVLRTGSTTWFPSDSDDDGIADAWEMDFLNGASLSLPDTNGVPVADDAEWDWEKTTEFVNHHHGDGITKLSEYRGVMIGPNHYRLSPMVKEVFVDTVESMYAGWAAQELENQLFVKAYRVAGLIAHGMQRGGFPGSLQLQWLGENETNGKVALNDIKVQDKGFGVKIPGLPRDSVMDGFIVTNGRYWTGRRVNGVLCNASPHWCYPDSLGVLYGETTTALYGNKTALDPTLSRVYVNTISNLLDVDVNSIPEFAVHTFVYPIPDYVPLWVSQYTGQDLDGGGIGLVNPLDLLSRTGVNDEVDGYSAGESVADIIRLTTLHEVGHAVGIGPMNTHPLTGESPMRIGHGPGSTDMFSLEDKAQFRLK